MGFWGQVAGFGVIALMVAATLLRAITRASKMEAGDLRERSMRVYRDQLSEVERDLARGTLQQAEAERLKLEIARRILDLDKDAAKAATGSAPPAMRGAVIGVVALALVGSAFLYLNVGAAGYPDMPLAQRHANALEVRQNRPRQAELEAEFRTAFPEPEMFEGRETLESMVGQLREALVRRPDDVTGFTLLAQNEARLGNMAAAIAAQVRVIDIKGDQVAAADLAFLLDLMALATGGIVSPEAEAVIERILRMDASQPIALYYLGRMYAQTGRPDMTFRVWRRLHDVSAGDDPWMGEIRTALPELSRLSGEPRWSLPPLPAPSAGHGTPRGPSAEDVEAAADMSAEDRMAMIESMVDGMMARLANDGGSAQDWAQLIRALTVLDRRDQAQAILQEARTVFAARTEDLSFINEMARQIGLSGTAQ